MNVFTSESLLIWGFLSPGPGEALHCMLQRLLRSSTPDSNTARHQTYRRSVDRFDQVCLSWDTSTAWTTGDPQPSA